MSEPKLSDVLHILRNPHGWSQEAIRAAQLKACDLLESISWVPVGERLPTHNYSVLAVVVESPVHHCDPADPMQSVYAAPAVQPDGDGPNARPGSLEARMWALCKFAEREFGHPITSSAPFEQAIYKGVAALRAATKATDTE